MLSITIKYSFALAFAIFHISNFSGYPIAKATQPAGREFTLFKTIPLLLYFGNDSVIRPWKIHASLTVSPCSVIIKKNKYTQLDLNYPLLKVNLLKAPDEGKNKKGSKLIIELPYPDGSFKTFSITKANIMSDELTAKYPELNAYTGVNILQPAESVRCECTGEGFKAMVTTLKGVVLINRCAKEDSLIYITYYKSDLVNQKKKDFEKPINKAN